MLWSVWRRRGETSCSCSSPVRFIFTNKLQKDDTLLLAFDVRVIRNAGCEVGLGKIIHPDDRATLNAPYGRRGVVR